MHCRGHRNEKLDSNGGATSNTVPNGGPVDRVWTGDRATNASTHI